MDIYKDLLDSIELVEKYLHQDDCDYSLISKEIASYILEQLNSIKIGINFANSRKQNELLDSYISDYFSIKYNMDCILIRDFVKRNNTPKLVLVSQR